MPIKCGGAPQKIMYLSEATWRKNRNRKDFDISWHTTVGNMFPNCLKYADALLPIAKQKNININFKS